VPETRHSKINLSIFYPHQHYYNCCCYYYYYHHVNSASYPQWNG